MEKLAREFDEIYELFDPTNAGQLSYTNFNLFLEKMAFTNHEAANAFLRREYRKGWEA